MIEHRTHFLSEEVPPTDYEALRGRMQGTRIDTMIAKIHISKLRCRGIRSAILLWFPDACSRTPENHPKCIIPGPGKILRSEGYVCANPGKFGVIFDEMWVYEGICQIRVNLDLGAIYMAKSG